MKFKKLLLLVCSISVLSGTLSSCDVGEAFKSDFSQLHTYCTGCPFSNKVSSSYDAFLEAKTSLDRFEVNEYAKTIFSCLDLAQPILIEMRTGKEVNWVNAFGDNYSSCVKNGK